MKKKLTILAMSMLLVFTFGAFQCAFAATGSAPFGTDKTDPNELTVETATLQYIKDQKAGGYKTVSTPTLKKWIDKKTKLVIIDTMPATSYKAQRIPGAKNVTVEMTTITSAQKKALIKAVGKNKKAKIVVYCGFVRCPRSHYAASYLVKKGYKNVYRLPGGIAAWMDAGYNYVSDTAGK